jgi:NarL family two-component system sensor histidine kinase YdfH
MISIKNHFKNFWQLISNPTLEQEERMGEGRSFYIVLTLILGIISVIVAYNSPLLQSPLRLVGFIAIMLLHVGLHWLSFLGVDNTRLGVAYLLVQGVLGILAVAISGAPELALAIFAAMIGETIGTFGTSWLSWSAVLAYLIMTPAGYFLVGGMETLRDWMSPTISTMTILIVFMVLFRKQLESSERAQALASDLKDANRQLVAYAARNESLALQAERERMARELHDTLAQGLAGLILQLEALKAYQQQKKHEKAETVVIQALDRARNTLSESRAAIEDLRNEDRDFKKTVKNLVEQFGNTGKTDYKLTIHLETDKPIRQQIRHHARRVLHEALTNIQKHAQADVAKVSVVQLENRLELTIQDNGIGFDPEEIPQRGHFGLQGFQERAQLTNSQLTLLSVPGKGTTVDFVFSLEETGEKI